MKLLGIVIVILIFFLLVLYLRHWFKRWKGKIIPFTERAIQKFLETENPVALTYINDQLLCRSGDRQGKKFPGLGSGGC